MSVGAELDAFESLAKALGILDQSGNPNDKWFADPVGASTNQHGLKEILSDDNQRKALESFVDEVLGPPDRNERDGATWVPLFTERTPNVAIYAVLKPVTGAVNIGIGVDHTMASGVPRVSTRVHVPLFRVARGAATLTGSDPTWLLLGKEDGRIDVALDLTLRDTPPPAGEASLGALAVTLGIPTDGTANLRLALELRDLQLPGATGVRTIALDAATPQQLGAEVLELLAALVRAQIDAVLGAGTSVPPQVKGLVGLLGLRDVTNLPPLPLGELPTRGLPVIVEWLRGVFNTTAARAAWFGQLRDILGGSIDGSAESVTVTAGAVKFTVGVRTTTGSGGALVVIPWVRLSLDTVPGAKVQLQVDVLRADLATGAVTAVPDLRAEALFGNQAGGAPLLTGSTAVGGLRTGLVLHADRRPAFSLTLHNVTVTGRPFDVLDVSSPGAAMTAVDIVVSSALDSAMTNFGAAGALIGKLLGIHAPGGVTGISSTALLANPLAEMTRYWRDLTSASSAMAEVLGAFRALVQSVPAANVPGNGTRAVPWRVELAAPLVLLVWKDGDALVIDAALDVVTPVLGDHVVTTTLRASLLRLAFTPVQVTFIGVVSATVELKAASGALELDIGDLQLSATAIRGAVSWSPVAGLRVDLDAPNARAIISLPKESVDLALPLPVRGADGRFSMPPALWPDVQRLISTLVAQSDVRVLDELLRLIGWSGDGPELALATLVEADPALAVKQWLADLLLDCDRVREAMGVVARLLSGGVLDRALGSGGVRSPYFAPIAGEVRAPGLAAWLVPACPPRLDFGKEVPVFRGNGLPEDGESFVARLHAAAEQLPDVRDLLTGRDSLADGFEDLIARVTDTDGVLAVPLTLPAGVTLVARADASYDDLVAEGAFGLLAPRLFATVPATVLHVGCDALWTVDRPAGRGIDATGATTVGAISDAGTGEWFVALPTPAVARAARPDHDAVAEQADRLARALATRSAPVTVIAYGAAGAAALRAASQRTVITEVVTVGSPWTPPSVTAYRSGLSADALRVLERMLRADAPLLGPAERATTATPLDVMRDVVRHALRTAASDDALPNAGAEARRAGLTCRAVFGAISEDTVRRGLSAILDDGIAARFEAAAAPEDAVPVERSSLHVGVEIPVLAASIGGVFVGLGATFDLGAVDRDLVQGVRFSFNRGVTVHLQLGLTDGWLVGGPSPEPGDVDVRWMQANVTVPFDGSAGDTELVLYEATGLGAFRERWVVRADADGISATQALPEVRAILAGVVARLRAASPDLGVLLEVIGLVREGGLDAPGLDRLLFEPHLLAAQVRSRGVDLATSLRALVAGMTGSGAALSWSVGDATLALDIAARTMSVGVSTSLGGDAVCTLAAALAADGKATADVTIGALDAHAGGVRLVGRAGAVNSVVVEWGAAGPVPPRAMMLFPTPDVAAFGAFASTVLPAYLVQGITSALRERADAAGQAALDAALDAVALLSAADDFGYRSVRLPIALFDAPGAWLQHGASAWRADPVGSAVQLLDALVPLVAPARGAEPGWPIVPGVRVNYAGTNGALALTLDVSLNATVGTAAVSTRLAGGVRIASTGHVEPSLDTTVTIDGTGLKLTVAPGVQLSLVRPAPAALLPIYPAGAGLGSVLSAVGESVLPPVLNALAARRTDAGATLIKDVGQAVFDLGGALDLREANSFTAARLTTFATDPAGRLLLRLPDLVGAGAAALAKALDPGRSVVTVDVTVPRKILITFGPGQKFSIALDATNPAPVVTFSGSLAVPAIGNIAIDGLRLSADGVGMTVRVGPAPILIGGVTLRPMLTVRAGVQAQNVTALAAFGLATDDTGKKAVELRWALNATPPRMAVVTRNPTEAVDFDEGHVALQLLSVAASIASGIALPVLLPVLPSAAITGLEKVLFVTTGSTTVLDTTLFDDLLTPEKLFNRLKRLAWNLATAGSPLGVTIGGKVRIALAANGAGTKQLGVSITLTDPKGLQLATGDPTVSLVVDPTWITGTPVPPGLSIYVLEGSVVGDVVSLIVKPSFTIGGIGLKFTKTGGPLLALGPIALDGIGVYFFGEVTSQGVGGGVQLELAGLAIAPAGGGGNPVAGGILKDAAKGGANNRPAFSPAVAVQARAGGDIGVTVRAGPPPGPWWLVVQRELGPLYLERIGLDTTTTNGSITRLQLLFDGRVSIFGLTAAVDQLSLTWTGGDAFKPENWRADLMGLAVSADFSGVTLAGGLLKDGDNGYLGMLLGRFGVYGLTVYGGYALIDNNPSFFIFGAINGPIGGPPAFFLTGIGAGLGINRQLRVPDDISQFAEYPFIKALDIAASVTNPMDELKRLNGYFKPQVGQFWVAAGISFTCFALVDGIAVVAVAFGSDGLDINLLGLARMALPRPQAPLVSIELALLARFSTREGIFSIRAQLTENSWLLYEDVRLTGGFAFVVWWKGPLAGQFVLSIGGYHPRFHRDGYPEVPRVGLIWQVTSDIVIKGGSYFALTSEALMAGVEVTVSADFGWAWARIEFGANGIVFFDPFWFEVEAYARISAGVKIKTFLGTIRFSLSTGATLVVHGPDFGGEASFEVGPCSITVPFGSDTRRKGTIVEWQPFVTKYLEDGAGGGARALSAITGVGTLPRKPGENKAESADGSEKRPFEVFCEFQIAITTSVPVTNVTLGPSNTPAGVAPRNAADQLTTLGIAPMGAGNLRSTLALTLAETSNPAAPVPVPNVLDAQVERIGFDMEAFPIGVWGEPASDQGAVPKGDIIRAMNRVRFDLRVQVGNSAIPPVKYRQVKVGRTVLPLQAAGAVRADIFSTAAALSIPAPTTVKGSLDTAAGLLFTPRGAVPTALQGKVLERGDPGAAAAAAYRGGRVAPPMFGSLADGLQKTNGADATGTAVPVVAVALPDLRAPRLVGLLAGGSGVIERGAMTTVRDRSFKRRPAPSIESVRSRLTRQLPVQLTRTSRPGVLDGRTIIAAGHVPFTPASGTARSIAVGRGVSAQGIGPVIGGLGPQRLGARAGGRAGAGAGPVLHAGDLAVLLSPDASVDLDLQRRPVLQLTGKARVTVAATDGTILLDAMSDAAVTIPPRAALIGIQAGGDVAVTDGIAGWHERTRMARFNHRVSVGPGCAVHIEGVVSDAPPAWLGASELIADATEVTTRLVGAVRTVGVILSGSDSPAFDEVILELDGARRVADKAGVERAPRVVMAGNRTTLLYDVVQVRGASVVVRVTPGGIWTLAGVMGGDMDSATLAQSITKQGPGGVLGRLLLAADGEPVTATWVPAPGPVGARVGASRASARKASGRKASSTKASAKKGSTKKTSAKKTSARKTSAKKAAAKKSSATKTSAKTSAAKKTRARTTSSRAPAAKRSRTGTTSRSTSRRTTTRRGGTAHAR